MTARGRIAPAALAAYLEGEVTASERAELEAELLSSASAQRTLQQLKNVKQLLSSPDPALESIDLAQRVRFAARQPPPEPRAPKRRLAALVLGGLAACLSGWLLLAGLPRERDEGLEFRAKAGGVSRPEAERWAGIQVFRVGEQGDPQPLGAELASHEGLLFSYTNLGPRPFGHLMIFAIDAASEVHWFYPAYERAEDDPRSVAIEPDRANVLLAERLQQDLAEGPLAIYGLFTPQPMSVREVEAWLREHPRPTLDRPDASGVLQRIDTRVTR